MVWRGSTTNREKLFACLVYSIPILEVLGFGYFLFQVFPFLELLFFPFIRILPIYGFSYQGVRLVEIAIFIALYAWVVQNRRIVHFLRFHTMQALLIAIFVFLCGALLELLGVTRSVVGLRPSGVEFLFSTSLLTGVFLVVIGAVIYAVIQAVRGLYAELPFFSDTVYKIVREWNP